jgi:hypothetical protein
LQVAFGGKDGETIRSLNGNSPNQGSVVVGIGKVHQMPGMQGGFRAILELSTMMFRSSSRKQVFQIIQLLLVVVVAVAVAVVSITSGGGDTIVVVDLKE